MPENNPKKIYLKIFLYSFVTMLIGFLSLLDEIKDINTLTKLEWIKMLSKSSIPALISIKAYLDTSSNSNTEENN